MSSTVKAESKYFAFVNYKVIWNERRFPNCLFHCLLQFAEKGNPFCFHNCRLRYHNMSAEERRNFNAKRASALRKSRLRDEQLCQLAESAELSGSSLDETIMSQVISNFGSLDAIKKS